MHAALDEPALQGKALCISHSNSARGAGEVSSANYEARAFGIRAGMFIARAKQLCPDLIVMPYEFDKYEAISEKVAHRPNELGFWVSIAVHHLQPMCAMDLNPDQAICWLCSGIQDPDEQDELCAAALL
jgi:hypothetical protein